MSNMASESSDDDDMDVDNYYLNAAARLKMLRKKNESNMISVDGSPKAVKSVPKTYLKNSPVNSTIVGSNIPNNVSSQNPTLRATRSRIHVIGNSPIRNVQSDVDLSRDDSPNQQEISFQDNFVLDDYDVRVKIKWKFNDVVVFEQKQKETFERLFQHFADSEGILKKQILIMKGDRRIRSTDTPESINLNIIDILEGGIMAEEVASEEPDLVEDDSNMCNIKVQASTKEKIVVALKLDECFEKVISTCAEKLNVSPSQIRLLFDGDEIKVTDTPESLDMEDEACVDLQILSS